MGEACIMKQDGMDSQSHAGQGSFHLLGQGTQKCQGKSFRSEGTHTSSTAFLGGGRVVEGVHYYAGDWAAAWYL